MSLTEVRIEKIPYALSLGMKCEITGDQLLFSLPTNERFIGNPMIKAFHGGIINAFLNCSMRLGAMSHENLEEPPRLVSITTTYLRSARIADDLNASIKINKTGKRIISIAAEVWQNSENDAARLVAEASASLKLTGA